MDLKAVTPLYRMPQPNPVGQLVPGDTGELSDSPPPPRAKALITTEPAPPHSGQAMGSVRSEIFRSSENTVPHDSHLYSYIGIVTSLLLNIARAR